MASSPRSKKDPAWTKLAGFILAMMMRVIYYTGRKTFSGQENLTRFFDSGEPLILAAWHNRNMLTPYCYLSCSPKQRRLHPIASASKDGALADSALRFLGLDPVRGSTGKGGARALRTMVKLVRKGEDLAFTPDGPKGPVYSVTDGVLLAARLTGAPIVPITFQARSRKLLNSWDRMIVPYPFTRLHFGYGEPIFVPRELQDDQLDEYRERLRLELNRIGEVVEQF